jgi:hypothetical protein
MQMGDQLSGKLNSLPPTGRALYLLFNMRLGRAKSRFQLCGKERNKFAPTENSSLKF